MRLLQRTWLALLLLIVGSTTAMAGSNQLAGHPSPYLALHGADPVHWQSWQAGVFAEARAANRLVLVSVGYFSCHWCHVMQRESYQDEQAAELLNRHFVAVKVDRELNPELDRRLIAFVQRVRGVAGWPLNVILTPEGYPLTGFTYLPREEFLRVLQRLDAAWQENHDDLSSSARAYFESGMRALDSQPIDLQVRDGELLKAFVAQAMSAADELQGGFGNTSKFPSVPQLHALLNSLELAPQYDTEIAEFIQLTLHSMATRNLQDHVNGGFFRYTTDPDWHTPHFEKMLYDNAMLASLYLEADALWPGRGYSGIALRTLDFIETRLAHPQGGYMSSLSAVGSDGREGSAYLWSQQRLDALLTPQQQAVLQKSWHFDSFSGDFLLRPDDNGIRPYRSGSDDEILRRLRQADAPVMPADDKRLAGWNAMMLQALTRAADREQRFAERARRQYQAMRRLFFVDGMLIRFAGHAELAAAVLEDYAEVAQAFFRYGRRFDDSEAIELARRLTERAHGLFLREGRWQSNTARLLPMDSGRWVIEDRVLFSPVTLWLRVALTLPDLDSAVRASADGILRRVVPEMLERPWDFGSLIVLRTGKLE